MQELKERLWEIKSAIVRLDKSYSVSAEEVQVKEVKTIVTGVIMFMLALISLKDRHPKTSKMEALIFLKILYCTPLPRVCYIVAGGL